MHLQQSSNAMQGDSSQPAGSRQPQAEIAASSQPAAMLLAARSITAWGCFGPAAQLRRSMASVCLGRAGCSRSKATETAQGQGRAHLAVGQSLLHQACDLVDWDGKAHPAAGPTPCRQPIFRDFVLHLQ